MKKIYNTPEADLLCFCAVEGLAAIDFNDIYSVTNSDVYGKADAATTSMATDIKINIKK